MRRAPFAARARLAPALTLVLVLLAAACSADVLHGIDERAANDAVAALERAGIGAEKVRDDGASAGGGATPFVVRVARGDGARAVDLLRAAGLPHERRRGFAETYGEGSLIPTPSEERARYLGALSGEVERTLESADGVVSARVHLVLEESDPAALDPAGAKPRTPARAAVLLKVRAGRPTLAEADVQKLVAGSVPGLDAPSVTVVTTPAAEPTEPSAALANVGPVRVAAGSRRVLLAGVAVALTLLGALAALLLVTARKLAALERAAPHSPEDEGAAPAQRP